MLKRLSYSLLLIGSCLGIIQAATVSGTVTDSVSGSAVAGIRVQLRVANRSIASDTTDESGAYSFEADSGAYTIRATGTNYVSKTVNVVVGNEPVTANIAIAQIVTSTVSGTITDSVAGTTIAGVVVRIGSQFNYTYDTTGADGTYSFTGVTTGNQSVRASATGYTSKTVNVTISAAPITANIQLVAIVTATISGTVTDSIAGTPVAGVAVRIGSQNNYRYDTTGTDGLYSFTGIATGNQSIRASATGYIPKTIAVAVNGADPVTANILLIAVVTSSISGSITDTATGSPIAGAAVRLGMGGRVQYDTTGFDGTYSFDDVVTGNQTIRVSITGYTTKSVNVTVGNGAATANVALVAIITTSITGVVSDSVAGTPIAGAMVRLGFGGSARYDTTGADGVYSFTGITSGNQTIRVSDSGYVTKSVNVTITSSTPVTQNFAIVAIVISSVIGVVTDATAGTPLAGVVVRLGFAQNYYQYDTTGADGAYSFADVTSGTYPVRATIQGYLTTTVNASVVTTSPVTANIQMSASASVTVSGVITDSITGNLLSGVVVRIGNLRDTTGANGAYSFDSVANSNQTVRVYLNGYATKTADITYNGSNPVTLNIAIAQASTAIDLFTNKIVLTPGFAISSEGFIKMANISGSGKLEIISLNGKVLFRSKIGNGSTLIAVPKNLLSGSTPFIVNITTQSTHLKRTVVPLNQ